ncbi:hypothetical protein [Nonomuraea gerenzanensis]|uniref:Uncharacterized protein n=1 Tax=Nonomuraea gerenzanensis TaxID=93944 RepID=A0A1M4EML4_9ACTN|nr:hypothetical protein [Nonomuraea gerenzanensis]UBU11582.1 hypothetical protein LCN96_45965 [Nonomuraea gerenzanensis]SBP00077.1 hypothetical protein BN4615_P9593 [Nonomuraea gerenzanensis]
MTALIIATLVVLFLSSAAQDARPADRTPLQVAATVRHTSWWRPAWRLLALIVGGLLIAL